jgi:hypothetical protein
MMQRKLYDEDKEVTSFLSWIIIILFSMGIIAFGMAVFLLVRDAPRRWEVGQIPDTPAESVLSTEKPHVSTPSLRQIEPLPEINDKAFLPRQKGEERERVP